MLIKTEGIVIKLMDYGESNKIITLYTPRYGKISVMAKGAKKPKSRFHGVTQLLTYGEYVLFMGQQMGNLNHGEIEHHFVDIKKNIEKTAYAAYMAELIDRIQEAKEANPYLFKQFLSGLEQINSGKDEEMVAMMFEMKLLQTAGYRPHLHSCAICGNRENLNYFSIQHGGIICSLHQEQESYLLDPGTVKVLKMFEQIDIQRLGNINVKSATRSQLKTIMKAFFDRHIGISLKSRHFIEQMKNLND